MTTLQSGLFDVSGQPAVDGTTGDLTFTPAADANGTATVMITAVDNGSNVPPNDDTSATQTFHITITPVNDPPSFTKGASQTKLEDAGPQSVSSWATNIKAGPANECSQTLTFNVTSDNNPTLFSAAPAVADDGTLTYTSAADANGVATIGIDLQDNGGTLNGGDDTSAIQTFTITVTAVNDAPSFTKGADQSVLEDAGVQTVTNWATNFVAGPANESGQNVLNYIVGNDNHGLFSVQPEVSNSGTLTFTLAADANGSATVTVQVQDNGGTLNGGVDTSVAQTFTISVTAVNDAPSFTKGPNKTVLEDAGPQTFAGWATGFDPGPANEAGQTVLDYILSNTNNALFSAQPDVSNSGTLTFTPAADANGSATVTIQVQDNGGTLNGGVDTSVAQTFTISVTAVNDPPSFTKGIDETVLEDSGAFTDTGWATAISPGPADESGETLSFTVVATDTTLFQVQPAVSGTTGTLTFTPAANAFGTTTVTVTAIDSGSNVPPNDDSSASQTFQVTITGVNDAPSFTTGGNVSDLEDTAHSAPWATGVSAGPGESGQVLTFAFSADDNPSLFTPGRPSRPTAP